MGQMLNGVPKIKIIKDYHGDAHKYEALSQDIILLRTMTTVAQRDISLFIPSTRC